MTRYVERTPHLSTAYRRKAIPRKLVTSILRIAQRSIFRRFCDEFPPSSTLRVLDLGINASLEREEQYFFEHLYPFRHQIVAAGLEDGATFRTLFPEIGYVRVFRGFPLPFADLQFDVVFCNAVIEHVGSRIDQQAFLSEIFRVARNGFVTTPNRWFPVELHTVLPLIHYLPSNVHRRLLRAFGFDFFSREENLNLFDRSSLLSVVPPDRGTRIRVVPFRFLGLVSNQLLVFKRDPV